MKAMVLKKTGQRLQLKEMPDPIPDDNQVLIKVNVCGICRTDLHVVDGDLKEAKLPIIPGHQIVGRIIALGKNVKSLSVDRSSIKIKTIGGYEGSFAVITCRGCLDPPCVPACPIEGAIRSRTKGGGVLVNRKICDSTKCNQEGVEACPIPGAIHVDPDLHNAIVCRQCGMCTKFCPTGVLIMEEPKPGF